MMRLSPEGDHRHDQEALVSRRPSRRSVVRRGVSITGWPPWHSFSRSSSRPRCSFAPRARYPRRNPIPTPSWSGH